MRGKMTFANVMSVVAVFISLGGIGYAAVKLPKNSVGTRQLKANAVTGAKVRNGSLTGADIDESTLGTVPSASNANHADSASTADSAGHADAATTADSAAHATSAADADKLGGVGPSGYLGAGAVVRIDSGTIAYGEETQLASAGDLGLRAWCHEGGIAENILEIEASSSGVGASVTTGAIKQGGSAEVRSSALNATWNSVFSATTPGEEKAAVVWLVYGDSGHTATVTLRARVSNTGARSCSVTGTAVVG